MYRIVRVIPCPDVEELNKKITGIAQPFFVADIKVIYDVPYILVAIYEKKKKVNAY